MDKNECWKLLEELSDPGISLERRTAIEAQLNEDTVLRDRLATFRILQEWPELDAADRPFVNSRAVMDKILMEKSGAAIDIEIKKVFPWVAAAALAAAVVLAFINIETMADNADTTLDAVFGLSIPTLEDTLLTDL